VNAGIRHIYRNPENIWDNTRFAEEFAGDNLVWPEDGRAVRVRSGKKRKKHSSKRKKSEKQQVDKV